jgi:GDP-L-fucose synthase
MADACVYLMNLPDEQFKTLLGSDEAATGVFMPPLVNIGVGHDLTIRELAETVRTWWAIREALNSIPASRTGRRLMDVGRLDTLGWRAPTAFRAGLREAYRDFTESTGQGN